MQLFNLSIAISYLFLQYSMYLSHQFLKVSFTRKKWWWLVAVNVHQQPAVPWKWLRASRFGEDHHLQSTSGINGLLKTFQVLLREGFLERYPPGWWGWKILEKDKVNEVNITSEAIDDWNLWVINWNSCKDHILAPEKSAGKVMIIAPHPPQQTFDQPGVIA